MKQTSASNVTSSKATQTIFDNFNKSVEMIKQNGDTLFENTEKVKGHFDNEVQANSGFITQFKGVLPNSHQNGVMNEKLLSFLSHPILANQSTLKQSLKTNSTNTHFPWLYVTILNLVLIILAIGFRKDWFKKIK